MDKNESKNDSERKDICRDFLRDDCRRGANCKYYHPSDIKPEVQFCYDFQNGNCTRSKCKFIHCAPDQEAKYTQQQPQAKPAQAGRGPNNRPAAQQQQQNMRQAKRPPPGAFNGGMGGAICRDYVAGTCTRGSSCKFAHPMPSNNFAPPPGMMMGGGGGGNDFNNGFGFNNGPCNDMLSGFGPDGFFNPLAMGGGGGLKRTRQDFDDGVGGMNMGGMMGSNFNPGTGMEVEKLQQENLMLRQKLDQCQKQILELQSANDMILEQNARLRMQSNANNAAGNAAQMSGMNSYMPNNSIPNSIPKPGPPPAQQQMRQMVPGYY